ncbi:hypothetical protein AMTRI_Chr06g172240 [Amborella trichopoda]|uniref:Exostosin GT47 domain-containing protein n=2 Tax=Amborella trichopoda TaxID=13333 RepID=W1PQI5_AMBTC|nr:probable arabinosyltransferase ARAD1 isoform X1 [Amborella trichopoda]ERN09976.1 hypothetical protein AMTR_s00013p00218260 [Amborella trichopoda]|eukprot:XP_020525552.1 probable arabinosyltransferase ARAD1 isoform X1 [Amborella trichopoda]
MLAKGLLLSFCVLLMVFIYLSLGSLDLRSQFFAPTIIAPSNSPLKIYMYNLPRHFNIGMLRRSDPHQDLPFTGQIPPWPQNSGLKKQHSVEYWMMASLLYEDGEGRDMEAIRVSDPEEADAFFVPFFSSLSFNTHGHNMTDPETEVDRQLQIELLEFLRISKFWEQSGGRDHVIPMHHPNAFRFLREKVNASILVVADFGRCPKNISSLSKDVVAPYVHVGDSFIDDDSSDPFESRTTLLFFRGRTVRKAEGIVRSKLAKILRGQEGVHFEESVATGESIKASSLGMRSSKFCLNPAGDTPSSCRLFDAIVSHCIPVIVSDRIELPYEDEIDYRTFSLFFSVEEALRPGYMLKELRQIKREKWVEMWRRLKEISHHFEFQFPPKRDDAVNMIWKQVRHKLPAAKLAVHRSRRLKIPDWWEKR